MITPRSNCGRRDCSFKIEHQQQTLVHNASVNTSDLNTVSGRMSCFNCEKAWVFVTSYQGTQFTETTKKATNDELQ